VPRFRYTALEPDGRSVQGLLELASEGEVVDRVQTQGRLLLKVEADTGWSALRAMLGADLLAGRGLSLRRVAECTRELSLLLTAGQSLDQALRFTIGVTTDKAAKAVLARVREKVRGGSSLAAALADEPGSFSRLYVGLVRAGEQSGTLGQTLGHLGALLDRQRAMVMRVRSAMIYPSLLVAAAIATVALMLLYVLPQFAPLFEQAGSQLPPSLAFMLAAGELLASCGMLALAALVLALAGLALALRREAVRLAVDRWLVRTPIVGGLVRQIEAARLTRALGTLLRSGVALVPALAITSGVLGNRAFVALVDGAAATVREGGSLADSLERQGLVPSRTLHLLRLGEETGELGALALRAAEIQEAEVERALEQLVAMIVPATTVVMGLVVAGIITSLMSAMLSLNQLAG